MQIRLNTHRGDNVPGDIVEIDDAEAAAMLHHGAAHPVDDTETDAPAETPAATGPDEAAPAETAQAAPKQAVKAKT